jgi:GNAT superfamily N-acetyltransferase
VPGGTDRVDRMTAAIRAATPDDIPAIRALLAAHGNDDPPGELRGPDVVGPYVAHLVAHHRVLVSEAADGIVAFGGVVDTGRSFMLSDLFVRPDRLGTGLGRPLLAALFEGCSPRATLASEDPRALPVYTRAGMLPLWPALYLRADASVAARAGQHARAHLLEVDSADPAELVALERSWTGCDRPVDHAFWASMPGADPFLVSNDDGPVALGYGRDRQTGPDARSLDRLVVRPDAAPNGPILAAIARAVAAGATVGFCLPGPNPALRVLLDLGARVVDRDTYMAGPTDLVDPARLVPNTGML